MLLWELQKKKLIDKRASIIHNFAVYCIFEDIRSVMQLVNAMACEKMDYTSESPAENAPRE